MLIHCYKQIFIYFFKKRPLFGVIDGNRWYGLRSSPTVRNSPTMGQKMDREGGRMTAAYFKVRSVSLWSDSGTSRSPQIVFH